MNPLRLSELESAERVEDFLDRLGVPYEAHVVAVHRTRLLRLFGRAVTALPLALLERGDDALRAAVRGALVAAYAGLSDAQAGRPVAAGREGLVQLGRPRPPAHSLPAGASGAAPGGGHLP